MTSQGAPLETDNPFSFDAIYRYPADHLQQANRSGRRKRVGVIGAGVAGLAAAFELEIRGHSVEIFEAASTPGGRICTHRFSDGTHGELGAMRIPSNHWCTMHYVELFSLPQRRFVNLNLNGYYLLRGERSRIRNWQEVAKGYDLNPRERRDPSRLFEDLMTVAMAKLSTPEKWELFSEKLSGLTRYYDAISLAQYCETVGLSREAFEFIGHANGMIQYERASFLETLVDYFGLLRVDQTELVGGMDCLVNAFLSRISGRIHLRSPVVAVSVRGRSRSRKPQDEALPEG